MPIPVFVNKEIGEPLRDGAVVERGRRRGSKREGADACGTPPTPRPSSATPTDAAEWDQVTDIIEVWFDLGSTHAFVLEQRPEFQTAGLGSISKAPTSIAAGLNSSLLEACGTRGRAPCTKPS